MIGIRPILAATAVVVGLTAALGAGTEPPEVALGARRLVEQRAAHADRSLAALEAALTPAVDAARAANAGVVAGDERPGPAVAEAAEAIIAAESAAAETRLAVEALDSARRAVEPAAEAIEPATEPGELGSIASQLAAGAEAANRFFEMRNRAAALAPELEAALVALEAGDLAAARTSAAEARAAHEAVTTWDVELDTLPVWIATTDAMIGAVETILTATEHGDAAAAEAAAGRFAALTDDGATADRALRIAMSEGGGAVLAAPLGRLASVLGRIEETRISIAALRQGVE